MRSVQRSVKSGHPRRRGSRPHIARRPHIAAPYLARAVEPGEEREDAAQAGLRCRPLTLLDCMILIAATGAGLGISRAMFSSSPFISPPLLIMEVPQLLVWTVAIFAMRLRGPRPPRHVMMCQPGAVACAAGTLFLPMAAAVAALAWVVKALLVQQGLLPPGRGQDLGTLWMFVSAFAGAVVSGSWLALLVSGRRCPEAGWIDGLGRVLGTLWVIHLGVLLGVAFQLFF